MLTLIPVRGMIRTVSNSIFVTLCIPIVFASGCKNITDAPDLPAGTQDITSFFDKDGAYIFYNTVVENFGLQGASVALSVGLFTDELHSSILLGNTDVLSGQRIFMSNSNDGDALQTDALRAREGMERYGGGTSGIVFNGWTGLHQLRADAMQGIGIFSEYTTEPSVFRGHLYAIIGYAEIQLADMFCSGVPLSTVDFKKDWTYRAGSTSAEVYEHAIALFDTALSLSVDSARILNLARVGKGRALLALGRYTDAAMAVSDVPLDFRYQQSLIWRRAALNFVSQVTMGNLEGGVGLPYISSHDPRTDSVFVGTNTFKARLYLPRKYPINVASPFILADGIEAKLIIAEARLQENKPGEWLQILNHLRQTAIVPALPPLRDPGTESMRIDTLFKERAFWLYLTGHRQGDLRRLVRQYGRDADTVYPTGMYPGSAEEYGNEVVLPIANSSEAVNPLFKGCLSYDA